MSATTKSGHRKYSNIGLLRQPQPTSDMPISVAAICVGVFEPTATTGSGLLVLERLVLERWRALLECGNKPFLAILQFKEDVLVVVVARPLRVTVD